MKEEICIKCGKKTKNKVLIMNDKWTYEPYCIQCARVFFSYIYPKTPDVQKWNITDLNSVSRIYEINLSNELIKKKTQKEGSKLTGDDLE